MVLRQDARGLVSRRGRWNGCSDVSCCSGRGCESRSPVIARYTMIPRRLTEQPPGQGLRRTCASTYEFFVGRERVPSTDNSMPDRLSRFSSPRKARLKLSASCLAEVIRSSMKQERLRLWLRRASRIPGQCLPRRLPGVLGKPPSRRAAALCSSSACIWRMTANAQEIEN